MSVIVKKAGLRGKVEPRLPRRTGSLETVEEGAHSINRGWWGGYVGEDRKLINRSGGKKEQVITNPS